MYVTQSTGSEFALETLMQTNMKRSTICSRAHFSYLHLFNTQVPNSFSKGYPRYPIDSFKKSYHTSKALPESTFRKLTPLVNINIGQVSSALNVSKVDFFDIDFVQQETKFFTNSTGEKHPYINDCTIRWSIFIAFRVFEQQFGNNNFVMAILTSLVFVITAESFSLYRSWRAGYFAEMAFYVMVSWVFTVGCLILALFGFKITENFSRVTLAIWFSLSLVSMIGWRSVFSRVLKALRMRGFNTRREAIFGLSEKSLRLIEQINSTPETGQRICAIYDDRSVEKLDPTHKGLYAGTTQQGILAAKEDTHVLIYISLLIAAQKRIHDMLYGLGNTTATVHIVPDLFMYCLMHGQIAHVGNMQTISVYDNPMRGGAAMFKRLEDIILSSIIHCVIALPMLIIAMAIKFTSTGPIIVKQHHYGLNGKKIEVWKCRSMTVTENSDVVKQATKNDSRITKVGAFIRRTSLDELPQFINVLQGSMSVIRPRPHAVSHNEEYRQQVDYYVLHHKVKPGITGWAQVNGWRGENDTFDEMEKRVQYDLEYICNGAVGSTLKILEMSFFEGL